jgi:membrane protein DedA with SNARE-associated domain
MQLFLETMGECWATIHSGGWPELGWWSYLLLILLVATEGPVSTLIGAAAAATGILDIRYVFLAAFIGNVVGDSLWYSIGYMNDVKRVHRFGSWLGIRSHHVDRLEHEMHTHATKLIALSKLAIGLIIPTLVAAGLARVPWRRWFPLVLLIEVSWTLLMVSLGFHGAGFINQMEQSLQLIGSALFVLLMAAAFWYGRRIFAQNEASIAAAESNQWLSSTAPVEVETVLLRNKVKRAPFAHARSAFYQQFAAPLTARKLITGRRTTYKQLFDRWRRPQFQQAALRRRAVAARSAMARSMVAASLCYTLPASQPSHPVQMHFAGD